jgi:peptide/nickel transport system ATP-binding protein
MSAATAPLIEARDVSITLFTPSATVFPVEKVSYSLCAGKTLAIVGESGSGKTVLNLAPLGLMPAGVTCDVGGSIRLEGREIVGLPEKAMQTVRGRQVGVIFQDPLSALNPMRRIGSQIAEVAEHHAGLTASGATERALDLMRLVGIPDANDRLRQFPHELSGGMRQRAMIAIAIAAEPKLLIADEPTTALDVTIQAQIIELLKDLQRRLHMGIVLITHDIGVVAGMADDVLVMYAGRMAEIGKAEAVLTAPRHPYTQALLNSIPDHITQVGSRFVGLPSAPPDLSNRPKGCAFAPRCEFVIETCRSARPPLVPVDSEASGHMSACPPGLGRIALRAAS